MNLNNCRDIMTKIFKVGKKMRILFFLFGIFLTLTLTQCESYDFARRAVRQGNLLPKSEIDRLKIGMSKDQVAHLMGNSLISPTFNNNRWDYAYTWRKGNGPMEIRHVSLYFVNNALADIEHKP